MPEFERSRRINAPAHDVYAFVSEIGNLPKYLPTTKAAQTQGEGRVRVQGGGEGFQYDSDGYFRANSDTMRLEWGADEHDYRGWLTVIGADGASDVTVHLSMTEHLPERLGEATGNEPPSGPPPIEEGLDASLLSIQNLIEGRGGKVEPAIAQ